MWMKVHTYEYMCVSMWEKDRDGKATGRGEEIEKQLFENLSSLSCFSFDKEFL